MQCSTCTVQYSAICWLLCTSVNTAYHHHYTTQQVELIKSTVTLLPPVYSTATWWHYALAIAQFSHKIYCQHDSGARQKKLAKRACLRLSLRNLLCSPQRSWKKIAPDPQKRNQRSLQVFKTRAFLVFQKRPDLTGRWNRVLEMSELHKCCLCVFNNYFVSLSAAAKSAPHPKAVRSNSYKVMIIQ